MTWDDENYYLIAYDAEEAKIKHYRVDKMRGIYSIEKKREGKDLFEEFDMAKYAKESFGMYGGETETVKLRVKNEQVGVIIDRFGKDITIQKDDKNHFTVRVEVNVSQQFFGWLFGLGNGVQIAGPKDVKDGFLEYMDRVREAY